MIISGVGRRGRSTGPRAAMGLLVAAAVAACAVLPGVSPSSSPIASPPPGRPSESPSTNPTLASTRPSAAQTTTPIVTPAPTAAPQLGTAWSLVDDPELASWPNMGQMSGVIAGGPGAIAWGETWGPAARNGGLPPLGPKIWTTANGRDWVAATVEPIAGADPSLPGAVMDIAPIGDGFVAIGRYLRPLAGFAAAVWTSGDGRTWELTADQPAFQGRLVGQVFAWRGGLLAFGCVRVSATDCGPPRTWTSPDGESWTESTPTLPPGIVSLGLMVAGRDRLWVDGSTSDDGPATLPGSPQPSWLYSGDGVVWTTSALGYLGGGRLHALPGATFFTAYEFPSGEPDFAGIADWMGRGPGVYRELDDAWEGVATGSQLGEEIVQVGGTFVMVGSTGAKCWQPSNCAAAAWRSTDRGTTWQTVPVTGTPPTPGALIRHVAALPDGTLVAVGWLAGPDGTPYNGAWVSPPVSAS